MTERVDITAAGNGGNRVGPAIDRHFNVTGHFIQPAFRLNGSESAQIFRFRLNLLLNHECIKTRFWYSLRLLI